MRSKKRVELLDLENDLPVTPEDSAAMERVKAARKISTAEYLAWCSWLTRDAVIPARDLHTERFEL